MSKIARIIAKEILDGRGLPAVEVMVALDNGITSTSSSPCGVSLGKDEANYVRDNNQDVMLGLGVSNAVNNINQIVGPKLVNMEINDQTTIDQTMVNLDGTEKKDRLGANTILALSQACLKAAAADANLELYDYISKRYQLCSGLEIPTCIYGVINGGSHGANNLDIQEFQIIPASHIDFQQSLYMAVTLHQLLERILIEKGATHSIGLVGGFTPNLYNNADVFEILVETVKRTNYHFAEDVFFGIDAAANNFYENGNYRLRDKQEPYSAGDLIEYYKDLRKSYQIIYLEDPFEETDLDAWKKLTAELGQTTKIAGDTLTSTNKNKLSIAIKDKTCNTLVVKPGQTGTVSETLEVIKIAKDAGIQVCISHRSGETNDDFIADFAVGVGADYAKFGPPNRGERVIKFNRLMTIYKLIQEGKTQNNHDQVINNQSAPATTQIPTTPAPASPPQTNAPATTVSTQTITPSQTANPTTPAPLSPPPMQTSTQTPTASTEPNTQMAATPVQNPVVVTANTLPPYPPQIQSVPQEINNNPLVTAVSVQPLVAPKIVPQLLPDPSELIQTITTATKEDVGLKPEKGMNPRIQTTLPEAVFKEITSEALPKVAATPGATTEVKIGETPVVNSVVTNNPTNANPGVETTLAGSANNQVTASSEVDTEAQELQKMINEQITLPE